MLNNFANHTGHRTAQFCIAMTARGEIVHKIVKASGVSVTRLAEKIGISRAQLYLDFNNPHMSFDRILAIGKALKHDFSTDFRELSPALLPAASDDVPSFSTALQDCQGKLLDMQGKLISAMELLGRYQKKYGLDI